MLKILRVFMITVLCIVWGTAFGRDKLDEEINEWSNRVQEEKREEIKLKDSITQINLKLVKKSITAKDKKTLFQQREQDVLKKWKFRYSQKLNNKYLRYLYSKKNHKMELKVSSRGVCKSPCEITVEALPDKRIKHLISKYNFYFNEKKIESSLSKVTTTLYFSLGLLSDKQKKMMKKNVPLHKIFRISAEAIIAENKMLDSEVKKIIVKSEPQNATTVELITTSVMPMSKIQLSTTGITTKSLAGKIDGKDINFILDETSGSSNIFTAIMPYFTNQKVVLTIANFELSINVIPPPIISDATIALEEFSDSNIEISNAIVSGPQFETIIGTDGVLVFSSFNKVLLAFDEYVKNEATPEEIQVIVNLINATMLSNGDAFYNAKNEQRPKDFIHKVITSNRIPKEIITKFLGFFIQESYAIELPISKLKDILLGAINDAIKNALKIGPKILLDGVINKCYISKARNVPGDVVDNETYLISLFNASVGLMLADPIAGVPLFISTLSGIQALVVRVGLDCNGDSTIVPKLRINYQPMLPINPGQTFQYDVSCDVADERFYNSIEILKSSSSRFEYLVPSLDQTGFLISSDKIVHACSGLGQGPLRTNNTILCNTNLLNETQYYQLNINQYETFNQASCNGKDSYEVGTYLVDSPTLSCDFVNAPNSIRKSSNIVQGNQLIFDLTKQWKCPVLPQTVVSSIFYSADKLNVMFDSVGNLNTSGLTYQWSFGDGQFSNSKSPFHSYAQQGSYSVSLKVINPQGQSSTSTISILVLSGKVAKLTHNSAGREITFNIEGIDPGQNLEYRWSFGDGETLVTTEGKTTHTYQDLFFREIDVQIFDRNGIMLYRVYDLLNDRSQTIFTKYVYNRNVRFHLNNILYFDQDEGISYEWTFGDGKKASTTVPYVHHSYLREGVYPVSVDVFDKNGKILSNEMSLDLKDSANGGSLVTSIEGDGEKTGMQILTGYLSPTNVEGFSYSYQHPFYGTCYVKGFEYIESSIYFQAYNCTTFDVYPFPEE